ncbi:MAG: YjbF family lipoprotein [Rhodocyclaceae bacterium]|nr:YjbF family lipoprotein [Rhodocyclaceae bacterium]
MNFRRALCLLALLACISGCTSLTSVLKLGSRSEAAAESLPLNSELKYLRVSVAGSVALLVLGYVDTDPQGDIETWYSAKGEVIKLQRGRIIGTIGLTTDWREVRSSAIPKWGDLPATGFEYQRERDEMPGYRMGVRERITLARISAPTNSRLRSLDSSRLLWFEETAVGDRDSAKRPPDRFAVQPESDANTVVYAEQCISPILCIAWQKWPAKNPSQ